MYITDITANTNREKIDTMISERAGVAASFSTCLCVVLVSNIGRDTGYPSWRFSWFFLVSSYKSRDRNSIGTRSLLSTSLFICRTIRHYRLTVYWQRRKITHKEHDSEWKYDSHSESKGDETVEPLIWTVHDTRFENCLYTQNLRRPGILVFEMNFSISSVHRCHCPVLLTIISLLFPHRF
jgi:hypothetical protein